MLPKSIDEIDWYAFENCDSLTDIYYAGSEYEWSNIEIDSFRNDALLNATIHYNSTGPDSGDTGTTIPDGRTTAVKYLTSWDETSKTAVFSDDSYIRYTAAADAELPSDGITQLVNRYVLVECAQDESDVNKGQLFRLQPVNSALGSLTAGTETTVTIDGVTYALDQNDGANTLHGGTKGYHQVLFDVKESNDSDEPSVTFTHVSPDGDENYPGTLTVEVQYTLTADNAVEITYRGKTDRKTVFNPTNHSFFNLKADGSKDVLSTLVTIHASEVTAVTDDLIPTGELLPVKGTPLDFTAAKPLGQDMFADDHLIQLCGGFDHNFCVDGEGMREIAVAYEPETGREMTVYSDMPGVQLYTFNGTSGLKNKDGSDMIPHGALCLETQFYPDSVHHENFPFRYVTPEKPFESKTIYKFTVK